MSFLAVAANSEPIMTIAILQIRNACRRRGSRCSSNKEVHMKESLWAGKQTDPHNTDPLEPDPRVITPAPSRPEISHNGRH